MSFDLELDAEQRAIGEAVARFCREEGAAAIARADGAPLPRGFWRGLAELGVFALAAPGGEGEGGAAELAAAFEALGAEACPGPLVATVLAVQLLAEPERGAVVRGEALVALGTPPLLAWAPEADVFVELDELEERAYLARPRGAVAPLRSLGGEPLGRVALERVATLEGVARARPLAELARAAWLCGAARRLLDDAAEHARTRRQFGRAIGEFQAVAHPLADVWIRLEAALALERAAAWALGAGDPGAAARAAVARLSAERAARTAVAAAHQTLGALGITLEGPLFHLSRRVRQLAALPPDVARAEALARARVGIEE